MTFFQIVVVDISARSKAAAAVRSVRSDKGLSELMSSVDEERPLVEEAFNGPNAEEIETQFIQILDALELRGVAYQLFQISKLPELTEVLRQTIDRSYIENIFVRNKEIAAEEDMFMGLEEE